jgi:hypothetical protein
MRFAPDQDPKSNLKFCSLVACASVSEYRRRRRKGWIMARALLALVLLVVGCTRENPAATCSDGECSDPSFPFCDLDGSISGTAGACIAVHCTAGDVGACRDQSALVCNAIGDNYDVVPCPNGCDSSGCLPYCSPGAALSCEGDQLSVCGPNGNSTIKQTCALGCATAEPRCLTFDPSNGLAAALVDSASEPDVTLPMGTRIDTDLGLAQDGNGNAIAVKSILVQQVGGPAIRVFEAKSFIVNDATVSGGNAIAFVATGSISILGRMQIRASGLVAGAGARELPAACVAPTRQEYQAACGIATVGAGGAGNQETGGYGGATSGNLGAAVQSFAPLAGGCRGGSILDVAGTSLVARGGGGGGAVQLVSATKVALAEQGLINVGGGGGQSSGGGGSGGVVIIEAPEVSMTGATAGVTANGGSGGGCGSTGADATSNTTAASAPYCMHLFAGNGGTATTSPGRGCTIGVDCPTTGYCAPRYGGGGGSVGRMRVVTKPGGFSTVAPLLSVSVTSATLSPR